MSDRPDWWTPGYEQAALAGIRDQRGETTPLDDRRQRACEAGQDAQDSCDCSWPNSLEAAIETATRVRITPEIRRAWRRAWRGEGSLADVFRAAGFEVEE